LTVRLIRKAIAKNGNRRYLIDGFPRSKDNFEAWKKIMKDDISLKELLFFECS
jgi:adenylate kinase family enzyme